MAHWLGPRAHTIDREIGTFPDAHAGVTQKEQDIINQVIAPQQFLQDELILLRSQRARQAAFMGLPRVDVVFRLRQCDKDNHGWRYFSRKGVLLGLFANGPLGDVADKPVAQRVEHVLNHSSKVHLQIRREFERVWRLVAKC